MARRKLSKEGELLLNFCKANKLEGWYIPEVRVGWSQVEELESLSHKAVDAVCILSKRHDYRIVEGGERVKPAATSLVKGNWKRQGKLFQDEPLALVEVKSGKLDYSAIGQLLVYKFLFKQDWPTAKVEQLWIVAGEDDAFIRPACDELHIKVWIKEPGSE